MFALGACGQLTCDSNLKSSRAANNRAIQFQKAGQYEAAEKEYRNAMALKPSNHEAAHNLGLMFESQSKWREASEAFNEALKRNDKNPMYHYNAGRALLERDCPEGKEGTRTCTTPPEEARREFDRAIQLSSGLYKAHYFLAQTLLQLDKPRDAAVSYTKAAETNARFLSPFIELANLYLSWDKWDEAQRVTTAALSVPENRQQRAQATMLYYLQGRASEFLKQNEKALEAYNNAVKLDDGNLEAVFHLGALYAKLGNKTEAIKWLEEAQKRGSNNAAMSDTIRHILGPLVNSAATPGGLPQ